MALFFDPRLVSLPSSHIVIFPKANTNLDL